MYRMHARHLFWIFCWCVRPGLAFAGSRRKRLGNETEKVPNEHPRSGRNVRNTVGRIISCVACLVEDVHLKEGMHQYASIHVLSRAENSIVRSNSMATTSSAPAILLPGQPLPSNFTQPPLPQCGPGCYEHNGRILAIVIGRPRREGHVSISCWSELIRPHLQNQDSRSRSCQADASGRL